MLKDRLQFIIKVYGSSFIIFGVTHLKPYNSLMPVNL
jgi:hypothetical protein